MPTGRRAAWSAARRLDPGDLALRRLEHPGARLLHALLEPLDLPREPVAGAERAHPARGAAEPRRALQPAAGDAVHEPLDAVLHVVRQGAHLPAVGPCNGGAAGAPRAGELVVHSGGEHAEVLQQGLALGLEVLQHLVCLPQAESFEEPPHDVVQDSGRRRLLQW